MGKRSRRPAREGKRNSEGTECEAECRERCSAGILEEYGNYINKERTALQEIPRGVKEWWTKSIRLLQKKGTVSSIPALRQDDGKWLHNAKDKANLFVSTLSRKFKMADAESNEYTMLDSILHRGQGPLKAFATKDAENILGALREDSGTGPYRLPSRFFFQGLREGARGACPAAGNSYSCYGRVARYVAGTLDRTALYEEQHFQSKELQGNPLDRTALQGHRETFENLMYALYHANSQFWGKSVCIYYW